ncbi:hypothetical protein Btru_039357 [Bulinus truncatus]|nr:hypothetical protein Btru_039357 [Bulinus truncatus]
MPSSKLEFSDMSYELSNMKQDSKGCHVSVVVGFILVLLAAAVAVGVGIIVHFAGGDREVVCKCEAVADAETVLQQCMRLASAGNQEICQKCPAQPSTIWTTSTPHRPETTTPTTTLTIQDNTTTFTASTTTEVSVPTTTDPAPAAVNNVRLPTSFYPLHYNMEIQTFLNGTHPDNFTFKGYVKIWLRCDSPTDNVTLHALNLTLVNDSVKFYGQPQQDALLDPKITGYDVDDQRQFLIFKLDKATQVNKTYIIEMSYSSKITNTLVGLYYTSYKRDDNTTVYLATTSFQPTDARKVFPCFDEPAMKSTFNLTLVRPVDMISLSNMEIIDSSQNLTDGNIVYVKDVFGQSPKMSIYLLVIAVCDFDYLRNVTKSGMEFRTYAVPGLVNTTQYSLDIGVEMLAYFEDFFNISYPLPKLDMIALPDFVSGAMEHWGLISYSETAMLYREGETSESAKEFVAIVVSHELAHMWFGNLVTMSWWDDLWLNEGFASYVENLGVDYVHPEWKLFDTYVVNDVHTALSNDGLVSSHPLYVPVNHPDEINEIFDSISYSKVTPLLQLPMSKPSLLNLPLFKSYHYSKATTVQSYDCSKLPLFKSTTVQSYHCSKLPLFKDTTVQSYHWSNLPLFKSTTIQSYHFSKLPLFKATTVQIYHCSNLPLFKATTVQIYHCSNLSLFKATTVQIYHYSNLPLFKATTIQIYHCSKLPLFKSTTVQSYHYSNLPLFKSTTVQIYHYSNLPLFKATTVQIYHCSKLPLFKSTTVQSYHYSNLPLFKATTVQIYHCSKLPLFKSTTVQIYHCSNLPLFKSTTVQSYHCSKLPLFKSTTVQSYHYSNLPLFKAGLVKTTPDKKPPLYFC